MLVATPLTAYDALPRDALAGTVVVDAGNYYPSRDGQIPALDDDTTTSTEWLAAKLPGARVVKAFNTVYWEVLRDKGDPDAGDDRLVVLVAGDDADAKQQVERLIEDVGFAPARPGRARRRRPAPAARRGALREGVHAPRGACRHPRRERSAARPPPGRIRA